MRLHTLKRLIEAETHIAEREVGAIVLNDQLVVGDVQRVVKSALERILIKLESE